MQCKAFSRVSKTELLEAQYALSYQELMEDPEMHLGEIVTALDLRFDKTHVKHTIYKNTGLHSKITDRDFNLPAAREIDQQVLDTYQDTFTRTFEWAERNLILSKFN